MFRAQRFIAVCPFLVVLSLVGCTKQTTSTLEIESSPSGPAVDSHAGHAHASKGPHHGSLIELGSEEYHAELLHDRSSVTVYILNGAANSQVPIDATEVTINTKRNGKPEQFQLAASPDNDDPSGKSSRFVSTDSNLANHIDTDDAQHKLVLTINGISYRGEILHDHE